MFELLLHLPTCPSGLLRLHGAHSTSTDDGVPLCVPESGLSVPNSTQLMVQPVSVQSLCAVTPESSDYSFSQCTRSSGCMVMWWPMVKQQSLQRLLRS